MWSSQNFSSFFFSSRRRHTILTCDWSSDVCSSDLRDGYLHRRMPVVERTRLQRSTFLVLFVLAAYAFWRTLEPIWVPVLLGLVIAVGVYPLYERLRERFPGKYPGLPAALLTTLVMTVSLGVIAFLV